MPDCIKKLLNCKKNSMATEELKEQLIQKIRETEDTGLLKEACRLLETESSDSTAYKLSVAERLEIEESRSQISRGEYLTNEQANDEIEQWLSK